MYPSPSPLGPDIPTYLTGAHALLVADALGEIGPIHTSHEPPKKYSHPLVSRMGTIICEF